MSEVAHRTTWTSFPANLYTPQAGPVRSQAVCSTACSEMGTGFSLVKPLVAKAVLQTEERLGRPIWSHEYFPAFGSPIPIGCWENAEQGNRQPADNGRPEAIGRRPLGWASAHADQRDRPVANFQNSPPLDNYGLNPPTGLPGPARRRPPDN